MARDSALEARLRPLLAGTRFALTEWHHSIGSTNTAAMDAGRAGAAEGLVVVADLQTAGRGRRGRKWEAPAGSALMMSILLRPAHDRLPPARAHLATTALGVAAVDACRIVAGVDVGLKWPNDLTVDPLAGAVGGPGYRKVAGVLTESVVTDGQVQALVCGIGLNTGWSTVPPELRDVAASLNLLGGQEVDRVALAASILTGFEARYSSLLSAGSDELMVDARRRSSTLGRRVRATSGSSTVEGMAVDLDEVGRLLIEIDDGSTHCFDVGDIDHLRPVDM